MRSKIQLLVVVAILLPKAIIMAQTTSVSPYSRFGLGEFNPAMNGRSAGMGGLRVAQFNTLFFNVDNPATLSRLEYTTFDFAVNQGIFFQDATSADAMVQNFNTNISHMKMAIPFGNKVTMAFGYAPYTFVGYNVSDHDAATDVLPAINYSYRGQGGYNQAYFALGAELYKGLSAGITGTFLFGDKEQINMIMPQFESRRLYRRDVINVRHQGMMFDYGLGYTHKLKKGKELMLGAKLRPSTSMSSIFQNASFSFIPSNIQGTIGEPFDTVSSLRDEDTKVTLPSEYAFGITLGKLGNVHPMHVWTVGAEIRRYNGSEYNYIHTAESLINSTYLGVGASLMPRYAFSKFERSTNYLNKLEYRIGAFHETGFIQVQNNTISTTGMTFGFSMPLRIRGLAPGEVKFNNINLGVTAGQRGSLENNLIRERFVQFNIGVTLSDKWFIKYKYR